MSRENVEIMRRAYDAFNRGDLDVLSAEFHDPQIEWQTSREDPDAAAHRGREDVRRYIGQWLDSFEGLRADVEEYIDAADDRVFTWARWTGRGRGSGIDAEWWLATVFTLRDGRVIRAEEYFNRSEALEAVGLSEYRGGS
jgi:ketosteroid isomerase-like protein